MTTSTSRVTVTFQRIDCLLLQGDIGGPLVLYLESDYYYGYVQVGIASFYGTRDYPYQHELPAGFTRVTSYLNWISSVTGISINY
jgi:secreted trypsin-like serine protease